MRLWAAVPFKFFCLWTGRYARRNGSVTTYLPSTKKTGKKTSGKEGAEEREVSALWEGHYYLELDETSGSAILPTL